HLRPARGQTSPGPPQADLASPSPESERGARGAPFFLGFREGLDSLQVLRGSLVAARIALLLVRDPLTLGQTAHARPLDRGNVHENVRAAVLRLDEAITLGAVKPLDGTDWHSVLRILE